MKFFDYEKLYRDSKGDCKKLVRLFQTAPSIGPNFILNPELIRAGSGYSDRVFAEYLGLCALRQYNNYVCGNEVDLDRHLIPPWIPHIVVEENPLVQLTNTKLIFKKEINEWL